MKRILKLVALVAILFGLTATASFAQFVGSETFSSSLGSNWGAVSYTDVGGFVSKDLSAGSGFLNWVATTNAAANVSNGGVAFLSWIANTGSYTSDWSVTLTVHNDWDRSAPSGQVDIGLILANLNDSNDYVKVVLKQATMGPPVNLVHSGVHENGSLVGSPANSASSTIGIDGTIGISYSNADKVISTFYDFGGGWTLLGRFGTNGSGGTSNATWDMGGSPAFGVGIMADAIISNGPFATNSITLNLGDVYADSFALSSTPITAVPEPSTYAALFGVAALGFVAWRRRRRV
jgi:hypothetical protein